MPARMRTHLTLTMCTQQKLDAIKWKLKKKMILTLLSFRTVNASHVLMLWNSIVGSGKLEIKLDDMHWLDAFIIACSRKTYTYSITFLRIIVVAALRAFEINNKTLHTQIKSNQIEIRIGWTLTELAFYILQKIFIVYKSKWCSYQLVIRCSIRACTKELKKVSSGGISDS